MKIKVRKFAFTFLLLVTGNSLFAINYPAHLLFKKYSVQISGLDSVRARLLLLNDYKKAIAEFKELEKWALEKGDQQLGYTIKFHQYQLQFTENKYGGNFEKDLIEFIADAEENDFNYVKTEGLGLIAEYYWRIKKNALALEYYIRAYENYTGFSEEEFPHKAYFLYEIGGRYYHFRDFATAKKYFREVWQTVPVHKIDNPISKLNTLALTYGHLEQYDSAIHYFYKALALITRPGDDIWTGIINGNIGSVKIKQNKLDEAIPLMEKNIEISRKYNELADLSIALSTLGNIYRIKNDAGKGLEMQLEALEIIKKKNLYKRFDITSRIYPNVARAYAAKGNMALAYSFLDSASMAKDSVEKDRNIAFVAGVQQKIEIEKHRAELQKKEAEIRHQKLYRNSLLGGFAIVLFFSIVVFIQKKKITEAKKQSDKLLLNILPADVAEELKNKGKTEARDYEMATVMFTDFKDFTKISEQLTPSKLVEDIDYCFSAFDHIIHKHGIEKIKTIGDAYMCVGGLPAKNITHPQDVIRAAIEIREFMEVHNREKLAKGETPFEIRIGINTGPVVAGIVGVKKFAYDIWGDTVNLANRMESQCEPGKINISGSTYELIKDEFSCIYRGKVEAKNKGEVDMYFVE